MESVFCYVGVFDCQNTADTAARTGVEFNEINRRNVAVLNLVKNGDDVVDTVKDLGLDLGGDRPTPPDREELNAAGFENFSIEKDDFEDDGDITDLDLAELISADALIDDVDDDF